MHPDLSHVLLVDLELDSSRLRPESGLEDAGLDSLGLVELSMALDQRHSVTISEQELASARTLTELDRLVTARLNARTIP